MMMKSMMGLQLSTEFLEFSELKFVPAPDIIIFGGPYSANMICNFFIRWSADNLSIFFKQEFAVVIYNAYVFFVISINMSVPIVFYGLPGTL